MPYRLKDIDDVSRQIEHIVTEQIDRAVGEIDNRNLDTPVTVHQVRKRCKKIRGVLRLGRGALEKDDIYSAENTRYRNIARNLSMLRDAEVLVDTHDAVSEAVQNPDLCIECAAVRGRLTTERRRIAGENANLEERLRAARAELLEGRDKIPEWTRRLRDFQDLKVGLEKTYRRGRRAMTAAYKSGSDETFHEFRKRVKYHWYACRLLRDVWPGEMNARCSELSRLSTVLGHEHDLSVYRATLQSNPGWFGRTTRVADILAVAENRQEALRQAARPPAMRLYAEKPRELTKRFHKYWQSRQVEDNED